MKIMLDTCIFNNLLDGEFELSRLPKDSEIYVTHIQKNELLATKKVERREKLLGIFIGVLQERMPTESSVCGVSVLGEAKLGTKSLPTESMKWGITNWGESKWTDSGSKSLCDQILIGLENLDPRSKKKLSHIRDALIAETAAANGITLVSSDKDLGKVLQDLGCPVMYVEVVPSKN